MKNNKGRILTLVVCLVMISTIFAAVPASANGIQPLDLSTWTAESYPAVSGFPPGAWIVSAGNTSVYQANNGQPTMFYSDFPAYNTQVEGTIVVDPGDNDYIGFAIGFQPGDSTSVTADYLLIDWKKGNQYYDFSSPSCGSGSDALAGLAVSRVLGVPIADEFWGHDDQEVACSPLGQGLTELARGTNLGNTGWVTGQLYNFRFDFNATSLKVYVDGVLEIDIAGAFNDGRLAFYNFSQAGVTYSGFTVETLVDIDIKPGSYPNSINLNSKGVIPIAILTNETFDATTVDPASVEFAGAAPIRWAVEDVDEDGDLDLIFFFKTQEVGIAAGDTEATLNGLLMDTTPFTGTDTVRTVPESTL